MKALLLSEYKHLAVAELPTPTPAAGEVLIRVAACGICGSDVHGYDGSSGRRIPPIVMGHEAAGIVAAIGAERHRLPDRRPRHFRLHRLLRRLRILPPRRNQPLRQPPGPRRLLRRLPPLRRLRRIRRRPRSASLYRLPDNLSFAEAAMLEAVSVALHAVRVSPMRRRRNGAGRRRRHDRPAHPAGCARRRCVARLRRRHRRRRASNSHARLGADGSPHLSGAEPGRRSPAAHRRPWRRRRPRSRGTHRDHRRPHRLRRAKAARSRWSATSRPRSRCRCKKWSPARFACRAPAPPPANIRRRSNSIASGKINVKPLITAVAPLEEGPRMVRAPPRPRAQPDESRSRLPRIAMAHGKCGASRSDNLFDLTGQVALVTGTSRGLGQYFARALARAGADLILTSRKQRHLAPFEAKSKRSAAAPLSLALDVRDQASIHDMAAPTRTPPSARSTSSSTTPAATSASPPSTSPGTTGTWCSTPICAAASSSRRQSRAA